MPNSYDFVGGSPFQKYENQQQQNYFQQQQQWQQQNQQQNPQFGGVQPNYGGTPYGQQQYGQIPQYNPLPNYNLNQNQQPPNQGQSPTRHTSGFNQFQSPEPSQPGGFAPPGSGIYLGNDVLNMGQAPPGTVSYQPPPGSTYAPQSYSPLSNYGNFMYRPTGRQNPFNNFGQSPAGGTMNPYYY